MQLNKSDEQLIFKRNDNHAKTPRDRGRGGGGAKV